MGLPNSAAGLIRSPEMSRAMGERGLHWLNEHISPPAWNQQFDEIIRKTLTG